MELAPCIATPTFATLAPTRAPAGKSLIERAFDKAMLALYPLVARALGYTFRVGTSEDLVRDAHSVHRAVWSAKGVKPPQDVAWYAERYDEATTWIVAYRRGRPVGVMGLLDMRIASVSLDYSRRLAPADLCLDTTREIGRLAIMPDHRGGARAVMLGLLREMLAWSLDHGIVQLFSGSTPKLFRMYRRYNPTAQLVDPPADTAEIPARERYFAPLRAYGGEGVLYTFDVEASSPWRVFTRCLAGRLHGAP